MGIILSAERIREIEKKNIESFGIGAEILMERAGYCIASYIMEEFPEDDTPILVVSGNGNNGADGLVIARILSENGYPVSVYIRPGSNSVLFNKNISILNNISDELGEVVDFVDIDEISDDYDVIVDALFGTGINRPLSDEDAYLVELINGLNGYIVSVDVPSGLNATTGEIYNACIKADTTVSLATYKTGQLMKSGPDVCGHLMVYDIGLWFNPDKNCDYYYLDEKEVLSTELIRKTTANKGTYGKALIIAGSEKIYGAAFLAAKAALTSGAGMIKVFTQENNRMLINKELPESLVETYDSLIDYEALEKSIKWADSVVLGPGLGLLESSRVIVSKTISSDSLKDKILIIDADAITILAKEKELLNVLFDNIGRNNIKCIMTPHKKELSRLMEGSSIIDEEEFCRYMYSNYGIYMINKDARTRIYGDKDYINLSGNDGMATAGSGDVLAGILGGLLNRINSEDFTYKVAYAVNLHGVCGDIAMEDIGTVSMTSLDILKAIPKALDSLT